MTLTEWMTLEQTARHISTELRQPTTPPEVIQLGLEGQLKLSFNFVNRSPAVLGTIKSLDAGEAVFFPIWHGGHRGVWLSRNASPRPALDNDNPELGDEAELISGVWEILMLEDAPRAIERIYHRMTGGPKVRPSSGDGILVRSIDGKLARLQEEAESRHPSFYNIHNYRLARDLPTQNGALVVRANALIEFEARFRAPFVVDQIPELIGDALHPPRPDDSEYTKAARHTAIEEYRKDIDDAVLSGEIQALWPATLKPVTHPRVAWPSEARAAREDIQAFLTKRRIPLTADTLLALLPRPLKHYEPPEHCDIVAEVQDLPLPPQSPPVQEPIIDGATQHDDSQANARPLTITEQRDREILRVIVELNFDPMALVRNTSGKDGIKAQVRARLNCTRSSFDHAWRRLTKAKRIAYAQISSP